MSHDNLLRIWKPSLFAVIALGACTHSTGTAGTNPQDMSIAQHESAAAREEKQAAQDTSAGSCKPDRVCWSDTQEQLAKHHELAERHRAAAQALSDAEARACTGLPEEDRDTSPFDHYSDLSSVSRLYDQVPGPYNSESRPFAGATIVIRAVPGLTTEWL